MEAGHDCPPRLGNVTGTELKILEGGDGGLKHFLLCSEAAALY